MCLSVSQRQFALLVRLQSIPLALRKTERIQYRDDERLLPRTLVPGVGQRSEVRSCYCLAGVLQLIYTCCTLARWTMNHERQSHTVIPDLLFPPTRHHPPPLLAPLEDRTFGLVFSRMSVT